MKHPILICLLGGILASCTWPAYKGGGTDDVYSYARHDRVVANRVTDDVKVLAEHIDLAKARIESLPEFIRAQRPGRVRIAEIQWARAARAYAGGMLGEAGADLVKLEQLMDALERTNDVSKPQIRPDKMKAKKEFGT
jgi:hypothetical protein